MTASVLTIALFTQRAYQTCIEQGLFEFTFVDYAIYGATAHVVTDIGWTHFYDTDAITEKLVEYFLPSHAPLTDTMKTGPSPYPALVILPFLVTNLFGPVGGLAAWTIFNALLVLVVARGLSWGSDRPGLVLVLIPFVYFPTLCGLYLGNIAFLMTFAFYKSYSAFQEGREFRAGLWLGGLLLKPQFALVLAIVLMGKGRWRALGGLSISGLALASSTIVLVGVDGMRGYLHILRSFSGFRRVPPCVNPRDMINFRGMLVNLLPAGSSENQGTILVLALSAALTLSLFVVWRGEWDPRAGRFPVQMLATLIVTMFTGYHNHTYGATLLIVPMLALMAHGERPESLKAMLLLMIFLPTYVSLMYNSFTYAAWSLMGVMACFYGVILAELRGGWRPTRSHGAEGRARPEGR